VSKCVVCDKPTSGSLEFCAKDYKIHKNEILDKKPWVRILKNDAQRERRRRERELNDTSLDQIMDNQYQKQY